MVNVHMINQTLRKSSSDGGSGGAGERTPRFLQNIKQRRRITTCLPGFSGLARHPCFKFLFEICVSN